MLIGPPRLLGEVRAPSTALSLNSGFLGNGTDDSIWALMGAREGKARIFLH